MVGAAWWKQVMISECQMDPSGFPSISSIYPEAFDDMMSVYFSEGVGGRMKPRCILVDSDPEGTNELKQSPEGRIFDSVEPVTGDGPCHMFAMGYYSKGGDMIDALEEAMRKEV